MTSPTFSYIPCRDRGPKLKPICVFILAALSAYQAPVRASDDMPQMAFATMQFDDRFMAGGGSRADLSRFEKANFVMPGIYSVDLYVNDLWIGRNEVSFKNMGAADGSAQACFDKDLMERSGVNLKKLAPDVLEKLNSPGSCWPITDIVAQSSAAFDLSVQRLDLKIEQIAMRNDARGYVDPEFWDKGVNVGFLNYNYNTYNSDTSGTRRQTQSYVGVNGGVNIGLWQFRHSGSYNYSTNGGGEYQSNQTYVQRSLPSLSSQLIIGEAYTTGEIFDSTSYRGVSIGTDERMLPASQRGYAPVVRGVARSNAKVTIKQNNMVVYETTVAPGAFEIDDLYPNGYGGDLHVTVLEADGSTSSFNVAYSAVPMALRPDDNRYSVTAGIVRMHTNLRGEGNASPMFVQGTWRRGFTNMLTGYTGFNMTSGYSAALIGSALNTTYGAIGLDYTHALTDLRERGRFSGGSMRLSYAKGINEVGTNVSLATYRYSTSGYFDLNSAVHARNLDAGTDINNVLRARSRTQVSLSQRLNDRLGQDRKSVV